MEFEVGKDYLVCDNKCLYMGKNPQCLHLFALYSHNDRYFIEEHELEEFEIEEYKEPKTKDVWVVWHKGVISGHTNAFCCVNEDILAEYKSDVGIDILSIKKLTLTEGEFDE